MSGTILKSIVALQNNAITVNITISDVYDLHKDEYRYQQVNAAITFEMAFCLLKHRSSIYLHCLIYSSVTCLRVIA